MTAPDKAEHLRLPILRGILPIAASRLPGDIVAGVTLAALAIPEVMGYTKIAGMPVITGLYTILIPIGPVRFVGLVAAPGGRRRLGDRRDPGRRARRGWRRRARRE